MKKSLLIVLLVMLMTVGTLTAGDTSFEKGQKFITGQIGLNSYAIPFGASYSMALTDNIEVGATLMLQMWSDFGFSFTVFTPSVDAYYHFTSLDLPVDLFAGASLGYSVFSSDTGYFGTYASSLYLSPLVGARYFFNDKLAVSLKLFFSVMGEFGGVGTLLGVTLLL